MVHIEDAGSEFEAPVEAVWAFLSAAEVHGKAHSSRRSVQATPSGENGIMLTFEMKLGDQWVRGRNRIARYPPLGMATEGLEGPLAGSKWMTYYTPKGNRTGVTVVGEFTSSSLPPDQIEATARRVMSEAFDEDAPAIRAFVAKK